MNPILLELIVVEFGKPDKGITRCGIRLARIVHESGDFPVTAERSEESA
jgi:hypothetical protein